MKSEDILAVLELITLITLFAFSIKMAYEHLFKKYNVEILNHFNMNYYSVTLIRKPTINEKKSNPFLKNNFTLRVFSVSPKINYKFLVVEFLDDKGVKRKKWVEIKIRYLRKPKLEFK